MINLELIFLPMILFLGVITSYEDIRFNKIKNKWIIFGLIYSFLAYAILITFYLFDGNINTHYLLELITNFLFAITVGFGLWYISIWTAGDGKLFIAYSALIPLSVYSLGYIKWAPSLILLINILLPAFIAMFVLMLVRTRVENIKKVFTDFFKETFQLNKLLRIALSLFAIFWIVNLFLLLVNINNTILRMVLIILIFLGIQKKLGKNALILFIGIACLRLIIDKSVYSMDFLINFLILVFLAKLIMSFLRGSFSNLGKEIFSKEINVNKLKPGMVLSEVIIKKKEIGKDKMNELKKQGAEIIRNKGYYYIKKSKSHIDFDNFIGEEAEGLTKAQIEMIKKIGIKKIKISQTMPFAPFIFLGVLLTLILRGSFISFLKTIF